MYRLHKQIWMLIGDIAAWSETFRSYRIIFPLLGRRNSEGVFCLRFASQRPTNAEFKLDAMLDEMHT